MMYKEDLDETKCSGLNCNHTSHEGPMYIHAVCHMNADLIVNYHDGMLDFSCGRCGQFVITIAVASRPI